MTTTTTQFVLDVPTDLVDTVTGALCAAGGYADVTADNAKQAVIDWITRTVQNVQVSQTVTQPVLPAPITGLS